MATPQVATTTALERYPKPELTWDKPLTKELPRQFDAFCLYRDLGPKRTLSETTRRIQLSAGQIRKWARRFYWVERAQIYDVDFDKRFRLSMEQKRYAMRERQQTLGQKLQAKAADGLELIKPSQLKPRDVAVLAETGVNIERLGLGEPTDIGENRNIIIQYDCGTPPWAHKKEEEGEADEQRGE